MAISPGDKLGPYEILSPLGEGGMGQVWKARDTRLNRSVAIKVSQKRFSERFEREAQAIAALNHPHICSLYDVGPDYLVMEYVEGKALAGPLPLDDALKLADQILDALDTAHRKGITHRDLKPGNILIGKSGVKVLDFGLAKMDPVSSAEGATQTIPLTGEGSILGTLQYMAPEQLEGKEADARSDIFSFGLVFYELLTGKRAFTGTSQASLIASILKEQPKPVRELVPVTPPGLERVLQTCLEKDPDKRWQSAREVKHALEWMAQASPAMAAVAAPKKIRLWQTAAAALALFGLGIGAWAFWPKTEAPGAITRFQVELPENISFAQYVSLSPDGRKMVFNATGQGGLWIRDLDALQWRQLAGTQGAVSPFWSPDNRYVGFGVGTQLKKIDLNTGLVQTLCDVGRAVGTGAWNTEGVIIFGGRGTGPMWRVPQAGGVATPLTAVETSRGEPFHALPTFLPDGKHFLYLRGGPPEVIGMYIGSLDVKPEEQSKERLLAGQFAATYADGHLFFMRENTLMVQPFNPGTQKLESEPVPVAESVSTTQSIGVFSVSPGGVLAYRTGATQDNYVLTWFDRAGKAQGTVGQPGVNGGVRLSPDGTRGLIRDADTNGNGDYWILDFARGIRTRLTFRQTPGNLAVWSPDGSRVAFAGGNLSDTIYEKAASGAGEERELLKEPGRIHQLADWSSDGRFLLYHITNDPQTQSDQWVLPLEGDRKPVRLISTEFNEGLGVLSPDMKWLAYASDESGRTEVYVRPFLRSGPSGSPGLGEGKWQVSKDGGAIPRWRRDEILFQAPGNRRLAVSAKARGDTFEAGIPTELFQAPPTSGWDVSFDGQRFLIAVPPTGQQPREAPITVVLNWRAQLKN